MILLLLDNLKGWNDFHFQQNLSLTPNEEKFHCNFKAIFQVSPAVDAAAWKSNFKFAVFTRLRPKTVETNFSVIFIALHPITSCARWHVTTGGTGLTAGPVVHRQRCPPVSWHVSGMYSPGDVVTSSQLPSTLWKICSPPHYGNDINLL